MLRPLLMDHPDVLRMAEDPMVAFAWCAEVAHKHGISPADAVKRLDIIMILGGWDGPIDDRSEATDKGVSSGGVERT